jgi:transposase
MNQLHVRTHDIQERIFHTIDTEKEVIPPRKRTAKTSIIPFKQAPEKYLQGTFFPSNIFNLLPEDHECVIYNEIFEQIDVTSLYKNYSVLGQNAYNPKLLISVLIYAYSQGLFSSRQIAEKLRLDIGFMYIGQMQKPNFRVLSDFRKDNKEFFKECFKQSVILAMTAGLVSLGHISLDGSKFKANTSKHKAMSYGRLKAKETELVKQIEELLQQAEECDLEEDKEYKERTGYEIPEDLKFKKDRLEKIKSAKEAIEKRENKLHPGKEIEDKKQISFSDHDATPVNSNKGDFDYKYNGQISVDSKAQIIVGQHLSQNANDKREVEPAIEELLSTVGTLPEKMSIDNGYFSGENLTTIEDKQIDAYVAVGRGEQGITSSEKLTKEEFVYEEKEDRYTCPNGKKLDLTSETNDGKKTYRAKKEDCTICPFNAKCCSSKKGEPRSINTDCYEGLRQAMRDKMQLGQSKEIYGLRKTIVEPVFGHIKNGGFRKFSLRGVEKVSGEFSLVCAVHNIKKIIRAIKNELVGIVDGKMVPQAA